MGHENDIVEIEKLPLADKSGLGLSEIFEQEVEKVKNSRGNENVRYAWLASTEDAVMEMPGGPLPIIMYEKFPSYGIGTFFQKILPTHGNSLLFSLSGPVTYILTYFLL